ncbi:MAG: hypothetical protein ACR2NM_16475, partial [Bythopirellula sp.]
MSTENVDNDGHFDVTTWQLCVSVQLVGVEKQLSEGRQAVECSSITLRQWGVEQAAWTTGNSGRRLSTDIKRVFHRGLSRLLNFVIHHDRHPRLNGSQDSLQFFDILLGGRVTGEPRFDGTTGMHDRRVIAATERVSDLGIA